MIIYNLHEKYHGENGMELYDRIKSLCDKKGIKPAALARELGFSKNFFTEMKSGRVKSCSAHKLSAIAEYFGVKTDDLLYDNKTEALRVPVFGSVPAGIPIEAIEDVMGYEEITPSLAATGKFIALRIKGDSMMPQICDGDTVIIRVQDDADTGDTVVAMIGGGDATCKKLKKDMGGVWLLPNNPAYEPMYYTNREVEELPIRLLGKIVELRRTF